MVEQDRRTASLITRNAATLGFARARVVAAHGRDGAPVARRPPPTTWCSPTRPTRCPTTDVAADLAALVAQGWLVPGALVIVERAAKRSQVVWPEGIVEDRTKRYGETALWYGHATPAP